MLSQNENQNKKARALSDSFGSDLDKKNALIEISSGNASQFLGHFSSNTCLSGARDPEVEEPVSAARSVLFEFEVNEIAEPKALLSRDMRTLNKQYGNAKQAARSIGVSEAFICQNSKS